MFGCPAFDLFASDKAGQIAVGQVMQGISYIVRPVHDLAFQRAFGVTVLSAIHKFKILILTVVKEFAFFCPVGPQYFILQDTINKCTTRLHTFVAFGIFVQLLSDDLQRLGIALKATGFAHQIVEHGLSGVPVRRIPKVMRQTNAFHQINIDRGFVENGFIKEVNDRAADLGNFQRMGQSGTIEVVRAGFEHLGFVLQTTKGAAVEHTVAIDLEHGTIMIIVPCPESFGIETIIKIRHY